LLQQYGLLPTPTLLMEMYARCYRDPLRRGLGLMLRKPRPVFLAGVNSVHTWFMLGPIWAVFLDGESRVIDVAYLRPWRLHSARGATGVLELPGGEKPPKKGDVLEVVCV